MWKPIRWLVSHSRGSCSDRHVHQLSRQCSGNNCAAASWSNSELVNSNSQTPSRFENSGNLLITEFYPTTSEQAAAAAAGRRTKLTRWISTDCELESIEKKNCKRRLHQMTSAADGEGASIISGSWVLVGWSFFSTILSSHVGEVQQYNIGGI